MHERDIFIAALERETVQDREQFLEETCGDDPTLKRRVEELLQERQALGGFLEPSSRHAAEGAVAEQPGDTIGAYKLLQEIGEGGFGVVYMAEQIEPVRRKVALKIIKPGMDTKDVIARFEAERQALAMMGHPNLAKVLDAGASETGRPYFVMELVHGIPITEFCDKRKLPVEERLRLFVDVCRAIQHAHQKGIIHRDLKPTNVMVTLYDGKPVPKVIDFGVSKALNQELTEKTLFTAYGQMVGTPMYMSPEQAEMSGLDVDTRSDVYSLGVLLYELLTGMTPFDKDALQSAGLDEMRRIIRQDEPQKPSVRISTVEAERLSTLSDDRQVDSRQFSHSLRGELDWIVMRSLEKDRNRRYESASDLASDVECHLSDEPVQARPPSAAYRFQKFARKNRAALIATSLIASFLLVAAVVASIAAVRFHRLAGRNANLAVSLEEALTDAKENLHLAKAATLRAEANLKRATAEEQRANQTLKRAQNEQQRAEENFDLAMRALNHVYLQAIGRQRLLREPDPTRGERELTAQEKRLLKIGLDFYVEIASQNETSPTASYQVASSFLQLGVIQANLGDHAAAEEALSKSIRRLKELSDSYPDNPQYFGQLGEACYIQATISRWWPDKKNTLAEAERALSNAIARDPTDAKSYSTRAHVRRMRAQGRDAAADLKKAVSLEPDNPHYHIQLADILTYSQTPGARNHRLALRHAKTAVEIDPQNAFYHATVGRITNLSGGDKRTALEHIDKAIELDPQFAWAYVQRAKIKRDSNLHQQALVDAQKGVELRPDWEYAVRWRGNIYMELGRYEEALADFDRAESLNPNGIWVYLDRGVTYTKLGEFRKALEDYNKAVELYPSSQDAHRLRVSACFQLGKYDSILADIGKFLKLKHTAALSWVSLQQVARCADESFQRGMLELADEAVRQTDTAQMRSRRGKLLMALGQQDRAIVDFQTAAEKRPDNAALLNNMAWCVVRSTDRSPKCIEPALEFAEKAAELTPQKDLIWNTLGVARYRAGKYSEAIKALATSEQIGNNRYLGFNGFFLAMAHWQLGHTYEARDWFDQSVRWMESKTQNNESLLRFRNEAEELMGIGTQKPASKNGDGGRLLRLVPIPAPKPSMNN